MIEWYEKEMKRLMEEIEELPTGCEEYEKAVADLKEIQRQKSEEQKLVNAQWSEYNRKKVDVGRVVLDILKIGISGALTVLCSWGAIDRIHRYQEKEILPRDEMAYVIKPKI